MYKVYFFGVTLYMLRTVFPSIIMRSRLYIQQQAYVKQILQADSSISLTYCCLLAVSVWHMPVAVCTVLNSWWWTERPFEACRVLLQYNKPYILMHLVGFTIVIILRCTALWTSNITELIKKFPALYDSRLYRYNNLRKCRSSVTLVALSLCFSLDFKFATISPPKIYFKPYPSNVENMVSP